MVRQAIAYMHAAGLDTADVIGFSDGAIIGPLLARDHPEGLSLTAISGNLEHVRLRAGAGDGGRSESRLVGAVRRLRPAFAGRASAPTEAGVHCVPGAGDGGRSGRDQSSTVAIRDAIPEAPCIVPGATHMLLGERQLVSALRVLSSALVAGMAMLTLAPASTTPVTAGVPAFTVIGR